MCGVNVQFIKQSAELIILYVKNSKFSQPELKRDVAYEIAIVNET